MNLIARSKILFVITSACLFGSSILCAQTQEIPLIKADFTVYSLQRLQGLNFVHGDRSDSTALKFYSSVRSEEYQYEGVNPIIFFKETPAPTADDPNAIQRTKVAEVNIPAPGGKFLFIFFPDKSSDKETYNVYPLDDSTQALPYGSIRLFNATQFTLEGVLGRERINLKPGPSESYRVNGNKVSLGLGFRYDGEFHQSFNSPLELNKGARGLMMIFPPWVKGSAIVQTRFIKENPVEKERDLIEPPITANATP